MTKTSELTKIRVFPKRSYILNFMQLAQQRYLLRDNDITLNEYDSQYVLKVKDLPDEEKPREKLLSLGPRSLTTTELVAVLLGVGTRKEEVLSMAARIVREYGERALIHETNPQKLSEALDIPLAKACQVVVGLELGRRYYARRGGKPVFVHNAHQAYEYLKNMGTLEKEQLRGLYLNSRYEVVHDEVISIGSLTANIIHPREVLAPALEYSAVAVILAHNHPSGSLEPTEADIEATEQISAAAKVLGLDLLDHLIITDKRFASIIECIAISKDF